jgi:hypothetical protein
VQLIFKVKVTLRPTTSRSVSPGFKAHEGLTTWYLFLLTFTSIPVAFRLSTHSPNIAWDRTPKKTLPHCCERPDPVENNSSLYCCVRVRCQVTSTPQAHSVHVTINVMAPEPIWKAYFINPSHQFVSVLLSLIVARQRLCKTQRYNKCWPRRFLCGPCHRKGN